MHSLSREERLRGRERIDSLFKAGSRGSAGPVLVLALENGLPRSRLLAVAGKKNGNAVTRNRIRRRLRAAFREQKDALPAGWDMAVMGRRGLESLGWTELSDMVRRAAEKAVRGRPPRTA